ncbi:MAG: tRNA pseudouridine(38-40) synthase TruA [Thermoflexales bacterium]
MKYRAVVAYDGTDFAGFQKQANARTVQAELERAVHQIVGRPTQVVGAGRTDAGVHATGQVVAFWAEWKHGEAVLLRALNAVLPSDIAVRCIAPCSERFHPRYDALSRTYEYVAYVDSVRQPTRQRYALQLHQQPDVERMNAAARAIIGEHDFAAFGSSPSEREGATTVRRVLRAQWHAEGDTLRFVIEANAFLYQMVRRIVHALLLVGDGRWSPEMLEQVLKSREPQQLQGIAPAKGLCLVKVTYQEQYEENQTVSHI